MMEENSCPAMRTAISRWPVLEKNRFWVYPNIGLRLCEACRKAIRSDKINFQREIPPISAVNDRGAKAGWVDAGRTGGDDGPPSIVCFEIRARGTSPGCY